MKLPEKKYPSDKPIHGIWRAQSYPKGIDMKREYEEEYEERRILKEKDIKRKGY